MGKEIGKNLVFAPADMAEDVSQKLATNFTLEKVLYALLALFLAYGAVFFHPKNY